MDFKRYPIIKDAAAFPFLMDFDSSLGFPGKGPLSSVTLALGFHFFRTGQASQAMSLHSWAHASAFSCLGFQPFGFLMGFSLRMFYNPSS